MKDSLFFGFRFENGRKKIPNGKKNEEKKKKIFEVRKNQFINLGPYDSYRNLYIVNHLGLLICIPDGRLIKNNSSRLA